MAYQERTANNRSRGKELTRARKSAAILAERRIGGSVERELFYDAADVLASRQTGGLAGYPGTPNGQD